MAPTIPFWSDRVIERACEMYAIPRETLVGKSRYKAHTRPRFAVAYTLTYLGMSASDVGRRLGGRDHSTILHARDKAAIYCKHERGYADVIGELVDAAIPGASETLDLPTYGGAGA